MATTDCILLIDDDEGIRDFVTMTLSDEGYTVVTAEDGASGLELLRTLRPRLVLLDMRMPLMDGGEFMQAYHEGPGPHAPVILLTAARNAASAARQISADAFLAKPFELRDLIDAVARHALPPEPV